MANIGLLIHRFWRYIMDDCVNWAGLVYDGEFFFQISKNHSFIHRDIVETPARTCILLRRIGASKLSHDNYDAGGGFFIHFTILSHKVKVFSLQCFFSMGLTGALWSVLGFGLAFGETAGHVIGNPASFPFLLNMDPCTPAGYPMSHGLKIPALLYSGYQAQFGMSHIPGHRLGLWWNLNYSPPACSAAIICPALVTGAFADRVLFPAYLVFIRSLSRLPVSLPLAHLHTSLPLAQGRWRGG